MVSCRSLARAPISTARTPSEIRSPAPAPTPATVHVLVLGGSQGSHAINIAMTAGVATLAASPRPIRVTHQTGSADLDPVRAGYRAAGITARVEVFLDAVEEDMASADLVVCRAGATTLAEVAAAGRAAVVVPFPHAAHDHQRRNAAVLAEAGADIESWSVYAMEEGPAAVRRIQSNAEADGVFGVPTFVIDNDIFWGREHLPVIQEILTV